MQDLTNSPLPKLLTREAESHKGDYGRVLVVGGSQGMAGAPALAGRAALRSGAGLVTVAVPSAIQATVANFEASYMTVGLGASDADRLLVARKQELVALAAERDVVALGPGLGTAEGSRELVGALYKSVEQSMVVDADALNALAMSAEHLEQPAGLRILTPHPGEFFRLTGASGVGEVAARAKAAAELCQRDRTGRTVVVLKGHQTIVTDGQQYAVNATGNPGMATGGTGDCLTGVIAALVGQGLSPLEAARLGVHVHGLAGDLAAAEVGEISLIASDLIDFLPAAFQTLQ